MGVGSSCAYVISLQCRLFGLSVEGFVAPLQSKFFN